MKNRRSKISYRRRLEDRTDYRNRLSLLRSGTPRLVVRKSLKNLVARCSCTVDLVVPINDYVKNLLNNLADCSATL